MNRCILPGWTCDSCGVFNGEAKTVRTECRSCGAVHTIPLQNTWMNNVVYLAAMAHIGWGCLLTLDGYILDSWRGMTAVSLALIPFAAVKEFWYDARFEVPKQTTKDNVQDFCGYLGGIALAWILVVTRYWMIK